MGIIEKLVYRSFANKLDFHILREMWGLWLLGGTKHFKDPYVEIDGRVFLDKLDGLEKGLKKGAGIEGFSAAEYQKYANHEHMSLFLEAWFWNYGDLADDYAFAAEFYEALLAHSLKKRFPEKEFIIERQTEEDGDITITFYQT